MKKRQHWQHWSLLMFIFSIMEFEQAVQWFWGDVEPLEHFLAAGGPTSCTKRNAVMSFVGWLFLFFQPLAVAGGAWLSLKEPRRSLFVFPCLFMIFSILMGIRNYDFDPTDTPTGVDVPRTNWGKYSCTYVGPRGHLLWKWAFFELEHVPNFSAYAAIVVISIGLMPRGSWLQIITFCGYALTYSVGWYWMGWVEELPAFWCYVSVVAAIPCSYLVLKNPVDSQLTLQDDASSIEHKHTNGTTDGNSHKTKAS